MSKKKSRAARAPQEAADPARTAARAPATSTQTAWAGLPGMLKVFEPASVALLFVALLSVTWQRWSDPVVDFPRSLYIAWRMTEGALPYVDMQSWYGPLPHLIEAAAFKIFGIGIDTLVWLNIAVAVGVLLLLRAIMGMFGNRLMVWLGSVVFVMVFVFARTIIIANYNFITPYASQATYGLAGLLLSVWAILRHIKDGRARWMWLAGVGVGVTFVNKPEPLLAAAGAGALYLAANTLHRLRGPEGGAWRWLVQSVGWMGAGFFSVWLAVFLALSFLGGPGYGFMGTNWVAHTLLSGSFVETGMSSGFNAALFGFEAPWRNFSDHLIYGVVLAAAIGAILLGGWLWDGAPRQAARWAGLALGLGVALVAGYAVNWQKSGVGMIFPVVLAVAFVICAAVRAAWRQTEDFPRLLGLAVFGAAAALMLTRMPLNGRLYHYGFFMMPLAVEFMLLLLFAVLPGWIGRGRRSGWVTPVAFTLVTLCAVGALWRVSSGIYGLQQLAVGEGRDRLYAIASNISVNGYMLKSVMEEVRAQEPGAATLVALPESAAFNYHLRIRNPIAEMEFQPTTLAFVGRERVLRDLAAHPPDIIVLYSRNLDEYGVRYFGKNLESGSEILDWILKNYDADVALVMPEGKSLFNSTGNVFDIYRRKGWTPPGKAP